MKDYPFSIFLYSTGEILITFLNSLEIIWIIYSYFETNLVNFHICKIQQATSLLDFLID